MPAIYKVSIASPMAGTSTPFGKRSFCKRSCTSYATSEHKQNLYRHSWPAQRAMCVPGGYCTLDPDAGAGCKCRCCCEDGPAPGPRLPARPSVGSGRPGRTEQPSRRASNGAVARSWRAMPRNSAVEKSRITFSMKIFLETETGALAHPPQSMLTNKRTGKRATWKNSCIRAHVCLDHPKCGQSLPKAACMQTPMTAARRHSRPPRTRAGRTSA